MTKISLFRINISSIVVFFVNKFEICLDFALILVLLVTKLSFKKPKALKLI